MLTELQIKALKPRDKLYRQADKSGLCIEVTPKSSKLWRFRYRYNGIPKMMALGEWPMVTLEKARNLHQEARKVLSNGIDPMEVRRSAVDDRLRKELRKFPVVAAEWLADKKSRVKTETYRKAEYVVNNDLIPALKRHSIEILATRDAAPVVASIGQRAPNLAAKARQYLNGIVTYAIQHGLREDGKALDLRGTVPTSTKGHIPAITKPAEFRELLLAMDGYKSQTTRIALKLASLTAMRPVIIASAQWAHINFDSAEWHVPASLMKAGNDHIVPLPRQAIDLLLEMKAVSGKEKYVFPSPAKQKTPHLHRDALSKALRDMGFEGKHSTHGFRGSLRTMGRERLNVSMDVLEAQLAHAKKGEVNKAYDRTTFDDERCKVMQQWADYLDVLRSDNKKVVAMNPRHVA